VTDPIALVDDLTGDPDYRGQLVHLERVAARPARLAAVPDDLPEVVRSRLAARGVASLWSHQVAAVALARAGRHVVVSTGTASGKSLCYQLPVFDALLGEGHRSALYLSPTKALARDQLRAVRSFALAGVRASAYDGDTPAADRPMIRRSANFVLTNPDMLHRGILPGHERWSAFLGRLAYVVVDEAHTLRGVFGSHVAAILRRLRRLAARYGASPTFVLASATLGNPAELAGRLVGLPVEAVTEDGSPRGPVSFALWEPPLLDETTGLRRSANTESAAWLAAAVEAEVRTLCFTRSRKSAELVAQFARGRVAEVDRRLARRVRAYRAGYLAEDGASSSRAWSRAGCSGWPPPTPWSWAWTSAAWTRSCSTATRARWPRCGSRPGGPAARASRRWPCSSARTTRSTPTCSTTRPTCSAGPTRPPLSLLRTRMCSPPICFAPPSRRR
jgi:DEAD/DEAH box helicase domain-containing protein